MAASTPVAVLPGQPASLTLGKPSSTTETPNLVAELELSRKADGETKADADDSDTDAGGEQNGSPKKPQVSQRKRQQHAVFDSW